MTGLVEVGNTVPLRLFDCLSLLVGLEAGPAGGFFVIEEAGLEGRI